jgi:hypothetical protein
MAPCGVYGLIDPVIYKLATLNPLWKFTAIDRHMRTNNDYYVSGFSVSQDGEKIGHISTSVMGGRGRVIAISNDRIGKARERTNTYRTDNPDKAIAMAKKTFSKMNRPERIEKAQELAERTLSRGQWNKDRELSTHRQFFNSAVFDWAKTEGLVMFMEYLHKCNLPHKAKIYEAMEKTETLSLEMHTIERVQKEFGDRKTALVVKDGGKYLVRAGGELNLYDDTSLPESMRMKLGMLKLVEAEQYLSDVGCRISSEVFVLLMDDLTNVSEGV